LSDTSISDPSLSGVRILWGIHNPYQIIIKEGESPIPWNEVKCVLWFPNFDTCENLDGQKILLQNFFQHLAIRILADALYEVQVILTMNNIRFSQLKVMLDAINNFMFCLLHRLLSCIDLSRGNCGSLD
jgi:hypothetical protein